jgi:hypothetical protein
VNLVLPLLLAALASFPDAGAVARHDLHVSYGNAVVEDRAIVVRLRLFKDDLEAALGAELGVSILAMSATPEIDQIFLRYLDEHLSIDVDGSRLEPEILARGEDLLDREPVWWYAIHYEAPSRVTSFRVRNTLLFELFDDQRNVMKFVHFPDEAQRTYAFARGEEEHRVTFGGTKPPR